MSSRFTVLAVLGLAAVSTAAHADEVLLKNGDHVTGKITSAAGGAIVIEPDFAKGSSLTIKADQIATFSTAAPLDVKLKTDKLPEQKTAQAGPPGQVVLAGPSAPPQVVALADIDQINPPQVKWHGAVGVNGLYSRSSTTAGQIGVTLAANRRIDANRITLDASYNYGRQSVDGVSTTNTDNWTVEGKYDRFFSPAWYGYADVAAGADSVNFLRLRLTPSVGAGRQWIDRGDFHLHTEGGLSWLYEDYSTRPQVTEQVALRLAYHIDKSFQAGRISVFHDLEFLPSVQNTREFLVNAAAGVKVNLTKSMYSDLTGKLTYDNDPAPGSEQTTTELRLGVGMTY